MGKTNAICRPGGLIELAEGCIAVGRYRQRLAHHNSAVFAATGV